MEEKKPVEKEFKKALVRDETIYFFDWSTYKGKRYQPFYGIGCVYRIVRKEKCDFVFVRFSPLKDRHPKLVILYSNQARRQLSTLKKGQMCQVYGACFHFRAKRERDLYPKQYYGLFAEAIIGWFVPTMLDIKKMPVNDHIEKPTKEDENEIEKLDSILDEFMVMKGDNGLWKD